MAILPHKPKRQLSTPRVRFAQTDESFEPNGRVYLYAPTNSPEKLLQSNCPTSAEKLGNFTAEVGEVLLSVFLIPRKEVIFVSYFVCKIEKYEFVFNKIYP